MALSNKRIIDLPERATLDSDDYTVVDGSNGGTGKYRLPQLQDAIADLRDDLSEYESIFTGDVDESVKNWLDAHPEATTTVQDGAISYSKLDETLKKLFPNGAVVVDDLSQMNIQSNTAYILKNGTYTATTVTASADNVLIIGNGAVINNTNGGKVFDIIGDNIEICNLKIINYGSFHPEASVPRYGTITITGDNYNIHNVSIDKVNKIGVFCIGNGYIHDNIIDGMITTGVYDVVSSNNQIFGIEVSTYGQEGHTHIDNNYICNCIEGFYYGDNAYVEASTKSVEINNNRFANCIDHSVYCNGGSYDRLVNNTSKNCGQYTVKAKKTAIIKNNFALDGFSDSSVSAVETMCGINARDIYDCEISGNCICGSQTETGICIYVQRLDTDVTTFDTVKISDNVIDVTGGTLMAVGASGMTINRIGVENNTFISRSGSRAQITIADTIESIDFVGNNIETNGTGIALYAPTILCGVISNNVINAIHTSTVDVLRHMTFSGVVIANNSFTNGLFVLQPADNNLLIQNNRLLWLNYHNATAGNRIVTNSNMVTINNSPAMNGTFTTDSAGVATFSNLNLTKFSKMLIYPTNAVASYKVDYSIGNNGSVTINGTPNTSYSYSII